MCGDHALPSGHTAKQQAGDSNRQAEVDAGRRGLGRHPRSFTVFELGQLHLELITKRSSPQRRRNLVGAGFKPARTTLESEPFNPSHDLVLGSLCDLCVFAVHFIRVSENTTATSLSNETEESVTLQLYP